MTKLTKSVINKIKKEKIKPIPRWQFVILHILLWSAFLVAIALGAIAFSVIFRLVGGIEWEMIRRIGRGPIHGFLLVLPYLWLVILGIVLYLAGKLFEKTKKGYRYKHIIIVLSSIAISLIIGMVFHFVGVGHSIEDSLMQNIRPYAEWREKRDRVLVVPDQGVLVGRVIDIKPDKELMIIDFMGAKWAVDISKAISKNDFQPQIGYPVGVIGEKIKEGAFRADMIMPFRPPKALDIKPRMLMPPKK
jgi:hypothetical protein